MMRVKTKPHPLQRGGWGKVVFKAHGLRSMGFLFLNDERKSKPHPLQRGGWGKVVFKAHGLRSMGLFFLLAHKDAAWVGLFAAIELK